MFYDPGHFDRFQYGAFVHSATLTGGAQCDSVLSFSGLPKHLEE